MGQNSAIEWTDHTFNPWVGCTMNWKHPLRWDRDARLAGIRQRVFCASLADVFDNEVPARWRADLFRLIRSTPNLDWLLLTKRIGNAAAMIERALVDGHLLTSREPAWPWPNVWVGATVVTQEEAVRDVPKLLQVPARGRFLSIEPMLGPINLQRIVLGTGHASFGEIKHINLTINALRPTISFNWPGLDWIIAGGESGAHARPTHPDWIRALRDQCKASGVPFLFKQWGEWAPTEGDSVQVTRVGKKAAGRALDGRTWDEFPNFEVSS